MSKYEKKDHYHQKAKQDGYLARSAYKLQEMQKKYKLFHAQSNVLDLGCAPGAWSQVVLETLNSRGSLTGIDLEEVHLQSDIAEFHKRDIFEIKPEELQHNKFDCILSDMAPKTTGIKFRDQAISAELCGRALEWSRDFLSPNGNLVMKVFEGEELKALSNQVRKSFKKMELFRPKSTRQASIEIYLIGKGKLSEN